MAKDKGNNMDLETRNALDTIEGRLEGLIKTLINEGFKEVKSIITELFNKDIDHINEHLGRHDKYHDEHFNEFKKIREEILGVRSSLSVEMKKEIQPLLSELDHLREKQITTEVSHITADKIEEKNERKKELSYGLIGTIVAAAALFGGGIGFLINYLG